MIGPQQHSGQGAGAQIWVATRPVDMRKSFDGLAEVVRAFLGHDPLSGNLFVFRNKAGHRVKILWWDRDGLAIFYKRVERGAFRFPASGKASAIMIDRAELLRLLSGVEIVARRAG
jgi:transposase